MERLLTTDELAEYLRVDVVTIRRLVSRGELPAFRIGSEFRFSASDLEDYLQRQRVTTSIGEGTGTSSDIPKGWVHKAVVSRDRFAPGRFDKFNEQARRVLNFAHEEARRFMHNYIGTEHLLLGLLRVEEGPGAQVLRNLGIELEMIREKIVYIIGQGNQVVLDEIGLTPRAKKGIELAVDEARRLNQHYIGTEHFLLGLIREGEGIAAGVLEGFGVTLEQARAEVLRIDQLQESGTDTVPPTPPEAAALLAEGDEGLICTHCGAHCPAYFRHCFNCGQQLNTQ